MTAYKPVFVGLTAIISAVCLAEQRYQLIDVYNQVPEHPDFFGIDDSNRLYGGSSELVEGRLRMAVRNPNGSVQVWNPPEGMRDAAAELHFTGDRLAVVVGGYGADASGDPYVWSSQAGYQALPRIYPQTQELVEFYDSNTRGEVLGVAELNPYTVESWRAARWREVNGVWTVDELPGVGDTIASAIDEEGWIAGSDAGDAFLWDPGLVKHSLSLPTGWHGFAKGYDSQGRIFGSVYKRNGGRYSYGVALWETMNSLGQITVLGENHPSGVNPLWFYVGDSHGTMVGRMKKVLAPQYPDYAVIYSQERGLENLNNLIGTASIDYNLFQATRINENGWILAWAKPTPTALITLRPVLLVPVPEPTSLLLLTPGLAWVVMRRRRG